MANVWSGYISFPEGLDGKLDGKRVYVTLGPDEIFRDDLGIAITGESAEFASQEYRKTLNASVVG